MATVLSIVSPADPQSAELALENHAAYCRRQGHVHRQVSFSHMRPRALWGLHVLHAAARALREVREGELLMVATFEGVIYRDAKLETLMADRDVLLTMERGVAPGPLQPQLNWLVVRRSEEGTRALAAAIEGAHLNMLRSSGWTAERAYAPLQPLAYYAQLDGVHLNINWHSDDNWQGANIFILNTLSGRRELMDGTYEDDPLADNRLDRIVRSQAHAASMGGDVHALPEYPPLPAAAYEALQPGGRIAFVMLHTPGIASYARISEPNLKRYCARHGIALHIYRDIPQDLDRAVNATWHKPDLLLRHFDAHDWVFWIDADVLVVDQARPVDSLVSGRDTVLAKDLGGSPFNAGIMGFRTTRDNRAALEEVRRRIRLVQDRSSVYVNGGDQTQFVQTFRDIGLLDRDGVLDLLVVNTPPILQGDDTFMIHYVGISEPYRSLYMAADDARVANA